MHGQLFHTLGAKAADAGVVPDIGTVASGLAETEAISVSRSPDLEDEDQLMLGAIEASHATVSLVPDTEVFHLREDGFTRVEKLAHVAPVHANESDCSVLGDRRSIRQSGPQKFRELFACHLARRESELSMAGLAQTRRMAVDRHVVGRVGENEVGGLLRHEARDACG